MMTTISRSLCLIALAFGTTLALAPLDAEAKRFGGARSSGMQRSTPDKAPPAAPAATPNNAAPAAAAAPPVAGAAAAAGKRSWMGPVAGLAAGLGLAALFSYLGFGEGLANIVMLMLLALAAFFVIRLLMRRFAGAPAQRPQVAMAGGGAVATPPPAAPRFVDERPGMQRDALVPVVAASAAAPILPDGFDGAGFERLARMLFIRMQAANDSADLDDLRNFTTPELFASLRLDLQDRGDAKQQTDVVNVAAKLIDFAEEDGRQIVSVRYTGLMREDLGAEAAAFDEVWHLVKPLDDSRNWAIAGIQQRA
jgi:predicted lipid-binding transport protein (Tim44 family)